MNTARALLITVAAVACLASCTTTSPPQSTLYQALGEYEGIEAITDSFLGELAGNQQALPLFLNSDISRFRAQFINHLCVTANGPCTYEGDAMRETHRGMGISTAQFNSIVENLIAALVANGVPTSTQNALLQRLARHYDEIVEEPF